jgi:hypothetical protein
VNAPSKVKMKRCRVCREPFMPRLTTQPCCYKYECQVTYATAHALKSQEKRVKADRKETREKKQALKTRSQWMKEAQIEFNRYIRMRDYGLACICCGLPLGNAENIGGGYDCGHYRSVGSAPHLRFDERNAHAQRKQCNRYGGGRAVDYRIGLIARIGVAEVEALEADQTAKHYTIDDLKAIKAKYKTLCRELERDRKEEADA